MPGLDGVLGAPIAAATERPPSSPPPPGSRPPRPLQEQSLFVVDGFQPTMTTIIGVALEWTAMPSHSLTTDTSCFHLVPAAVCPLSYPMVSPTSLALFESLIACLRPKTRLFLLPACYRCVSRNKVPLVPCRGAVVWPNGFPLWATPNPRLRLILAPLCVYSRSALPRTSIEGLCSNRPVSRLRWTLSASSSAPLGLLSDILSSQNVRLLPIRSTVDSPCAITCLQEPGRGVVRILTA